MAKIKKFESSTPDEPTKAPVDVIMAIGDLFTEITPLDQLPIDREQVNIATKSLININRFAMSTRHLLEMLDAVKNPGSEAAKKRYYAPAEQLMGSVKSWSRDAMALQEQMGDPTLVEQSDIGRVANALAPFNQPTEDAARLAATFVAQCSSTANEIATASAAWTESRRLSTSSSQREELEQQQINALLPLIESIHLPQNVSDWIAHCSNTLAGAILDKVEAFNPDPQEIRNRGRAALATGDAGPRRTHFHQSWSLQAIDRLESDAELGQALGIALFGEGIDKPSNRIKRDDFNRLIELNSISTLHGGAQTQSITRRIAPLQALSSVRESAESMRNKPGLYAFKTLCEQDGEWFSMAKPSLLSAAGIGAANKRTRSGETISKDFAFLDECAQSCMMRSPINALWRGSASPKLQKAYSIPKESSAYAGHAELADVADRAKRYEFFASRAACSAFSIQSKLSAKTSLVEELAQISAMGFTELDESSRPEDYLPESHAKSQKIQTKSGDAPLQWKANAELSKDPMSAIVSAAARGRIGAFSEGLGAVGEAKSALSTQFGLSNSAWKALASNPELRSAFAKMLTQANPEAFISASSARRGGSTQKRVQEALRLADDAADSLWSQMAKKSGKEAGLAFARAASNIALAGSTYNLPVETQAFLLNWCLDHPIASATLGGRIPLPKTINAHYDDTPSIQAETAQALAEDAQSWNGKIPAAIKWLAAKAAKAGLGPQATTECSNALQDLKDIAQNMPAGFFSGLDPKAPMEHARRMHDEWQAEANRNAMVKLSGGESAKWTKIHPEPIESGSLLATELGNGKELYDEGQTMSHCVASYSSNCQNGVSRIFSVVKGGVKACTLELAPYDAFGDRMSSLDFADPAKRAMAKSWRSVQNRGKHNRAILEPDLTEFCARIEKIAQAQFEADTPLIAEARLKEKLARKEAARPTTPEQIRPVDAQP